MEFFFVKSKVWGYRSDEGKFYSMLNPENHKETKEIFLNAEKLLKFLPKPTIIPTKD